MRLHGNRRASLASMPFSQLLSVIYGRRTLVLAIFATIVALVAGFSLLQPKQYLATAAVLIDVKSPDPVAGTGSSGLSSASGYLATQIDLLQSERVARRALRALHLDADAGWRERWTTSAKGLGDYEAWLADQLLKKLEVKPSRESSVVTVGYLSTDPAFSAAVANAFVRSYIDTTLEMKVEPAKQYNAFFDERAKQLRGSLEQAQGRLSAYQQAKGIVATDERLDVENTRLSELSSQVVVLQGMAAESAGRQGFGGANSQEVMSNVMIGSITGDLSRQEAKLSELRERLGERNPQVIELVANVGQLRARLASETRRVAGSLNVNTNVDRARLAQAQASLAEQRARLLRLRGQRDEAAVLIRDVDSAQRAYDAALTRVTQTSLESQTTFTNVAIIKTASPPATATSPRVLLNIAAAMVVGALLASAAALVRESMDRRLRFDSDVTVALNQPLLARIPRGAASDVGKDPRLTLRKTGVVHGRRRIAA